MFAYRLAKELGEWDVDKMLTSMTWGQLRGWMEYASIEPFGEDRADYRAGVVAAIIANVHRDTKRHPAPFTPVDFMPLVKTDKSGPARSNRRPLKDPTEWRKVKSMARAYAGGRE